MDEVLYEVTEQVAVITLNRPARLNSLTASCLDALDDAARRARDDDAVLAIVVTGAGEAFSVGGDLGDLIPRLTAGGDTLVVSDPTKRFFSDVFKPIIAAVNGPCIAGGLEIMLGTDIRVASENAVFALGEVRWGVIPAAGTHVRLPRQIPWAIAMQLLLTGRPITAQRAYEVGLINEIAEPAQVLERAIRYARDIVSNAPLAVRTAKEIAVRAMQLEQGFTLEHALAARVLGSHDAIEGPKAFLEKRKPDYTGT